MLLNWILKCLVVKTPSQPMDGADYDTDSDDYSDNDEDYGDEGRVYIGLCVGRE